MIVDYVDEGKRTTSLFDSSKLDTKDQYDVFLGGDFSVVDIKTVSTESKRLLLIKDSFADCFVQFLTPYYREIVVVDPRYYSGTIEERSVPTGSQRCCSFTVEIHFLQIII